MSLILDALNKSRSAADEIPGLAAEHYREEPPKPWLKYLPWAGLALAGLLIIWLLVAGGEEPEGSVVSPVAELSQNIGSAATSVTGQLKARADESREKRAAKAKPVPQVVAPAEVADKAAGKTAGKTAGKANNAPAQEVVAEPVAAVPAEKAEVADTAAIKALYAKRERSGQALLERAARAKAAEADGQPVEPKTQPAAQPPVLEEPVDVEEVLRQAQQDVANASLVEHPAPFLVSLSQQTKNDIPTILYQRHDYSSQASRASVTLNGKTVRVGGAPASGLKVDEILEDSVVLSYRGTQFRLRALNSWVNL